MDTKTLIDEINQKRLEASIDLESVDIRLRLGAEGRKRSAAAELSALEARYMDGILENVLIIAVNGPGAAQFAEIAEKKFRFTTINYMLAADETYQNVLSRGGKDTYSSNEHWMVMDELNRIKINNRIVSLPPLQANFADIGFEKPLRSSIHHMFVKHYGSTLYSIVSKREIGKKALSIGFSRNFLPVILYNYTIELDKTILLEPFCVLKIENNPTEDYVKSSLLDIQKACKAKLTSREGESNENRNE